MAKERLHDAGLERSVVGSALRDKENFLALCKIIRKADIFSQYPHVVAWRTMYRMVREGLPWEPKVFGELLIKQKEIDDCRPAYIVDLWEEASPVAATHHAKILVELYVRRAAVQAIADLRKEIGDPAEPPLVMLERVKRAFDDIAREGFVDSIDGQDADRNKYVPFPVDDLPASVRDYVVACSDALHCDPAYLAVPCLVAIAAAIGNSRSIELKGSWEEPSIIWAAIVADSSSMKSPSMDMALRPLWLLQRNMGKGFQYDWDHYKQKVDEWRRERWSKKADAGSYADCPAEPEKPKLPKLIVSDITIEKLGHVMFENPHGVVLLRDELSGWLASFGRYNDRGPSADMANWLQLYGARSLVVDRKSGDPPSFTVNRASCSVYGTIQPEILKRQLTSEFFDSGMTSRILLAMPPRRPKVWSEAMIPETVHEAYMGLVRGIYESGEDILATTDGDPKRITFNKGGKSAFIEFYKEWAERQDGAEGEYAYALAKLEAYCGRIALAIAVAEKVESPYRKEEVGESHVRRSFSLVRWFAYEAERVYRMLRTDSKESTEERLSALIKRREGKMTPRDLQRSNPNRWKTATEAETALQGFVDKKIGTWYTNGHGATGGRPTKEFHLTPDTTET